MQTMTSRAWIGLVATVVATSMVTAIATTALANHQFSDVATGSFFHDEIAAIFDAGCAGGFADSTFRPNSATTRGQFTYWLNNCGGRVAFAVRRAAPVCLAYPRRQSCQCLVPHQLRLHLTRGGCAAPANGRGGRVGCRLLPVPMAE